MDSGDTDDRLLQRIGAGERQAFAVLTERHLDRVYRLALRVLGRSADAEEVAQEVFLQVWQRADRWRPGRAQFSTWLYRVTLNRALDYRQRAGPEHAVWDESVAPGDPVPPAEQALEQAARRQQIERALAELPLNQRTAMSLTYDSGLSNAAAAQVMQISVKALEALLVRARRALRERLAAELIEK